MSIGISAASAIDITNIPMPNPFRQQTIPNVSTSPRPKQVINYVSIHGSTEQIEKVRHDLYSRYGLETAGAIGQVLPDGSGLFSIVGAVSGHVVAARENSSKNR